MRQFKTLQSAIESKSTNPSIGDIIEVTATDGSAARWSFEGTTGQAPSQSPAQLVDALFNDGNGNQWALVGDKVSFESLGFGVEAFNAFVTAASKGFGLCSTLVDLNEETINIPSNTKITFKGSGGIKDGRLLLQGEVEAEINLTTDADAGSSVITLGSHSYSIGDILRIKSCINCLSPDAGEWQLGSITGNTEYFGEFVEVKEITATTITTKTPLIFPYTITPGPDSGIRAVSTVEKVNFVEGVEIKGINAIGRPSNRSQTIQCEFAKGALISGRFEDDGATGNFVVFKDSLDCKVTKAVTKKPKYTGGGSTRNSLVTYGSQNCGFENVDITGGGQGVDFTFRSVDAEPVPSVNCFISNGRFTDMVDTVTTHPGCFSTKMDNVHGYNVDQGFRLRSKADQLTNWSITNTREAKASGFGLYLEGSFFEGGLVDSGSVMGSFYGVQLGLDDDSDTPSIIAGRCKLSNTVISHCVNAVTMPSQVANNVIRPIDILNTTVIDCTTNGIFIDEYNNGVNIDGITVIGGLSGGAVRWGRNSIELSIDNLVCIGMGGSYGLRGPSSSLMITDLTTFPLGEAEAQLSIGKITYKGTDVGFEDTGVIRDSSAFKQSLSGFDYSYKVGSQRVRQQSSTVVNDLAEWQSSNGTKVQGVSVAGRLSGTKSATVKSAISVAVDLTALKAALDDLFE